MIIMDEPELSLHPVLQKKTMDLLCEYSTDRQIVYATHSPYFVSWDALFNGGRLVRMRKEGVSIKPGSPTNDTLEALRGIARDEHNPHVLGLAAREVFFIEDGVVLVEGQEDVLFYPRVAEQMGRDLKGHVFGWGVGGATKMHAIAALLRDLGFHRVVGIVDRNKEDELPSLKRDFQQFRWFALPADDIRSKPDRGAVAEVRGVLDERGNVRDEFKGALDQLFQGVNAALGDG
jgi:predicted ATP-dependent endonuclease of OLD family